MIASAELRSLTEAVCNGTATADEFDRLNVLLGADERAALFYATYLRMHGLLLWRYRDEIIIPESVPFPAPAPSEIQPPVYLTFARYGEPESQAAPLVRLAALGSIMMVLVVATVALYWNRSTARAPVAVHGVLPGVGYLTGMTDCQWTEGTPPASFYDRVAIGQTLRLDAGLLEITYDTGFKAILQGPMTYRITSENGGALAVGKLTGKATTDRARGFVVDMPGASVTDLGTEFGVEVTPEGTVETVVFSGEVKLVATTSRGDVGKGQILRTGQAATVRRRRPASPTAHAQERPRLPEVQILPTAGRERFTREIPATAGQVLLSPDLGNGSFEDPAVGPDNCDPEASDLAVGVFVKSRDAAIPFWNPAPSVSVWTKGEVVEGVTGRQYAVIERKNGILSTRFNGKAGRPALGEYQPNTVYVLTADLGANVRGASARVVLDGGSYGISCSASISTADRETLEPIRMLVLNTAAYPAFVGKSIGVSFVKTDASPMSRLYVDNVVLRAFPLHP